MNPPASKELLLIVGFGGLFLGALFLYVGWRLWREGRELRRAGVAASANILKKFRKAGDRSWGGLENYYVQCSFQDEARVPREVEVKLPSKLWRQLGEGSTLTIIYLRGRFESARAGSRRGWKMRGAIGIIIIIYGLLAFVIFPLIALWGWFKSGQ